MNRGGSTADRKNAVFFENAVEGISKLLLMDVTSTLILLWQKIYYASLDH